MATGMQMDERSVDCLIMGPNDQDRKVSAKSVTKRAMTLCKNLSGYRELLLISWLVPDACLWLGPPWLNLTAIFFSSDYLSVMSPFLCSMC